MKSKIIFITLFIFCFTGLSPKETLSTSDKINFPDIAGMKKEEKPSVYKPDTLFEYIDGAADQFIDYEFKILHSQSYKGDNGKDITIDIYEHASPEYAFGMYSQEKPKEGTFLDIGSQGYWEEGILNFYKGSFYVKIAAFDLGTDELSILSMISKKIASGLTGTAKLPDELKMFPDSGRIKNSEQFVSKNFLGYSFFKSVFLSRYKLTGNPFRVFIIMTKSREAASGIITEYSSYLRRKKSSISVSGKDHIFKDPNYVREGEVIIRKCRKILIGIITKNNSDISIIDAIEKKMIKKIKNSNKVE